tara:strand:+ start:266 stop:526 length:261 start_codon:yes stop_codon:yes gene_type:complete
MEKQERKLLAKYLNNSGKNTIRVEVEDIKKHSKYKKYLKKTKRYLVHCVDENVTLNQGDKVMIQSTRRISKRKSFIFVGKIEEGDK